MSERIEEARAQVRSIYPCGCCACWHCESWDADVDDLIAAVREDEREQCAKVAEHEFNNEEAGMEGADQDVVEWHDARAEMARKIKNLIRARGTK